MKILFLPNNIASNTAITVRAINKTEKHQAKGIIFIEANKMQSHEGLKVIAFKKNGIGRYLLFVKWYFFFLKYLVWCDVVHWNGSFNNFLLRLTLPVIKLFKKPGLIEFVGGERNPEIEMQDNEYYREIYYGGYEYPYETVKNWETIQRLFSKAGFSALAMPGLSQHYSRSYFKRLYKCPPRIDISKFNPVYPDVHNKRRLIIHSPSAPIAKGTYQIVEVINELKKEFDFEFKLIQNTPHKEALALLSDADIFIDQIKLGHYGMACMEALASGKPTICYIKQFVLENDFPKDIPIINATIKNLKEVLRDLLSNQNVLNDIGLRSRIYAEKFHDVKNVIPKLLEIYKEEIEQRK